MSQQIVGSSIKSVPTATLSASSQALNAPATVYGLSGYNSKASAQFIQIHDSATAPADTAVPVFNMTVAATANFSIDFGVYGMPFLNGVYICNSSTAPTKTIGSADCQFFTRLAPT